MKCCSLPPKIIAKTLLWICPTFFVFSLPCRHAFHHGSANGCSLDPGTLSTYPNLHCQSWEQAHGFWFSIIMHLHLNLLFYLFLCSVCAYTALVLICKLSELKIIITTCFLVFLSPGLMCNVLFSTRAVGYWSIQNGQLTIYLFPVLTE